MQRDEVIVFLGPSLALTEAQLILDAEYRMPANRGDIYRASKSDPQIIVVIDGAFESGAAVLHNEILWALSKGIRVFGAASMGALRAAELAPFGMIGVGKIFEAYRDGSLERDDAVAVVHGPAELGYPLLSTPLVDVWATLERASELGLLSAEEHDILRGLAAKFFYKRLSVNTLIETAVQKELAEEGAEHLRTYVKDHGIFSQKRQDAIEVLTFISSQAALPSASATSYFAFERTSAWNKLVAEQEHDFVEGSVCDSELELAAIGLGLAEKEAERRGYVIGPSEFQEAARSFRQENKLSTFLDVQRWMEAAGFDHDDYVKLIEDEFIIRRSSAFTPGHFATLLSRVNRRRRCALSKLRTQAKHLL